MLVGKDASVCGLALTSSPTRLDTVVVVLVLFAPTVAGSFTAVPLANAAFTIYVTLGNLRNAPAVEEREPQDRPGASRSHLHPAHLRHLLALPAGHAGEGGGGHAERPEDALSRRAGGAVGGGETAQNPRRSMPRAPSFKLKLRVVEGTVRLNDRARSRPYASEHLSLRESAEQTGSANATLRRRRHCGLAVSRDERGSAGANFD